MSDNRETRRLKAEVDRLRVKLHAAHDLLHNDRLNDLHELLPGLLEEITLAAIAVVERRLAEAQAEYENA